jgi:hypothetical protein
MTPTYATSQQALDVTGETGNSRREPTDCEANAVRQPREWHQARLANGTRPDAVDVIEERQLAARRPPTPPGRRNCQQASAMDVGGNRHDPREATLADTEATRREPTQGKAAAVRRRTRQRGQARDAGCER